MRYIYFLSIIFCAILLMGNVNTQNENSQFDGFAYKSAGFDVMLDLPETLYDYTGIEIPDHYVINNNSPQIDYFFGNSGFQLPTHDVEIENNAATLGRVIFYDQNMSFNRTVSCGSCHKKAKGFADDKIKSEGFDGILTHRNTLSITDFRTSFYPSLFWDDRSQDIYEASILPLLNSEEMGMTMSEIIDRMEDTDYYPDLFNKAYQSNEITDDKIAEALTQFLVSISSYESKYDAGFDSDFENFTESELNGWHIFKAHCNNCHLDIIPQFDENLIRDNNFLEFATQILNFNRPHNTGLNLHLRDLGVANTTGIEADEGKFKIPSLKNVEHTSPYMHDGRFKTLEGVIHFYSEDLQPHPNSTFVNFPEYQQVQDTITLPITGFKFSNKERQNLKAFLLTLTDEKMIANPMFSDPFVRVISSVEELNEVEQFKVYPNPFTHVLNVDFSNPKGVLATVKLFDLKGQLLKHGVTKSNTYVLERDHLPAGTYIVEVLLDDKTSNTRIIAQ